jgi:hypothetical protein
MAVPCPPLVEETLETARRRPVERLSGRAHPWAGEGGKGLPATSRPRQTARAHEGTWAWAWRGGGAGRRRRWRRWSWRRGKGCGNQGVGWPGAPWCGCRDRGGSTRVWSAASTPSCDAHPHRSRATRPQPNIVGARPVTMARAWGRRVDAGAGTPPKWRGEEIAHGMGQLLLLYTRSVLRWLSGFSTRRWFFYTTTVSRLYSVIFFSAGARGGGG